MSNFVNLLDIIYPVGSIYQSMSATSPASTIGGTWTQLETFLYGSTIAKQTGGEATHTLTVNEMPNHTHDMNYSLSGTNLSIPSNVGNWYVFDSNFGWICPRNPVKLNGGGQHTTTYRPTRPASSGIAPLKSKRGGVCLITLTSWILSTQLGQYLFQTRQSHQRIQSGGRGRNSIATRLSAAARLVLQVETIKELWQQLICRQMYGLREVLGKHYMETQRPLVPYLIKVLDTASKLCVSLIEKKTCIHARLLTTAPSTELLTSISAQPSYILGGVA